MRGSRVLVVLLLAVLSLSACDGDEPAGTGRFGSADVDELVLDPSAAPDGMDLVNGSSGAVTVDQLTGDLDRAAWLRQSDVGPGYLSFFERPIGGGTFRADTLLTWALPFPDATGASRALERLRSEPESNRSDVRMGQVRGLGEGAFLQRSRIDGESSVAFIWQVRNALVALEARSSEGAPRTEPLVKLARSLVRANDRVEPTGRELNVEIPEIEKVFEDDFSSEGDWGTEPEDPEPGGLTRYVAGGLLVGIDGFGSRWEDTIGIEDGRLGALEQPAVEVTAEHVQGDTARWGLMCHVVEDAGFYLFILGTDGDAGIFSSVGRSEPLEEIAFAESVPEVKRAVERGTHRIRASCVGDPITTLSLEVNGETLLSAYDDDPRAGGAVGLWIESKTGPAGVLFDDLVVSAAEEG
jgi:hypothetical protein